MRPVNKGALSHLLVCGTLITLGAWAIGTNAPGQTPADKNDKAGPTPGKSDEKRIAFEMRDKPWGAVLEWLSDQTGLPIVGPEGRPQGTFTFISPKGKTYTIPEVIDILNRALLAKPKNDRYIIIRQPTTLTLMPGDAQIDPANLPRIREEDLGKHGETEMVSVVVPLKALGAVELAREIEKPGLMGPFGSVVAMEQANQLVIQDTVANLRRILDTIKHIERGEEGTADTLTYQCRYIRSSAAEKTLKHFLGLEIDQGPQPRQNSDRERREREMREREMRDRFAERFGLRGFGGGGFGQFPQFGSGFRGDLGGDQRQQAQQPQQTGVRRPTYVTSDDRTNTVLVNGPAKTVAQAREVLKKIDVPERDGQQPIHVGAPYLRRYAVSTGNAETVATTLQSIYRTARIDAVGNNALLVHAAPADHVEIERQLKGGDHKDIKTELLPLNTLDAVAVAATFEAMYAKAAEVGGAPFVRADTDRNALIVNGTEEQIASVRDTLKALGDTVTPSGNFRIINVEGGNAAALAETLQKMMQQMRQNPVRVITPTDERQRRPERREDAPPPGRDEGRGAGVEGGGLQPIAYVEPEQQLVDPQEQKPAGPKPGDKDAPVNITAVGNRLVITSDDPKALELANELVRLMTRGGGGKGPFTIIRLRNTSAEDAARTINMMYNGTPTGQPQQQQQFGGFGGFGRFAQALQQPQTPPAEPRVRVVADPGSNSLLIRASPLDLMEIRSILEKSIDSDEPVDSKAVVRARLLPPLKHASAWEVAAVIRDAYSQFTGTQAQQTMVGGFQGFGFGRGNQQNNNRPTSSSLAVAVDERSNQLIVTCTESMFEDIQKLVKQLDEAAANAQSTVQVVSIKGIDPLLVQQAVDAIQGRRSNFRSDPAGNSFGGFGNQGGRNPFGGGFGQGGGGRGQGFGGGQGFSGGQGGFGGGQGFGAGMIFRGGGQGGFGFGGGGGNRGGGPGGGFPGGGGNRGGGGRRASLDAERGPDFFAQGVMDDPQQTILFDPQLAEVEPPSFPITVNVAAAAGQQEAAQSSPVAKATILQVRHEEAGGEQEQQPLTQAQPPGKQQPPAASPSITGPRSSVTAEALPELGVIVIRGNNPQDVAETVKLIEYIQRLGQGADVEIRLVSLQFADATSVANTLAQLYQRVLIGAGANTAAPRTGPTTIFGQQIQQAPSVTLLPLPRFNAILLAAPRARIEDIIKEIRRLDRPNSPQGLANSFYLKNASAAQVAQLLTNFYAQRYPNEQTTQNQIRITSDTLTNSVLVQAARADMEEIAALIERLDTTISNAVNELRVIPLRSALADELATLLIQAISQGVAAPSPVAAPTPAVPGAPFAQQPLQQLPGALPGQALPGLGGQGVSTKTTSLRFLSKREPTGILSGQLQDVFITPDLRTNSLIVSAPSQTMSLLEAVIRELDVPPPLRADIKVFQLKRADATTFANTLFQLFYGTAAGVGGQVGVPGAVPGAQLGGQLGTGVRLQQFALSGAEPGPAIIEPRVSVDARTNSVIVAASRGDIEVVEALVARLDEADVEFRRFEVYHLKNAIAADVANALTTFLTQSLAVLQNAQLSVGFADVEREVVVVAEPISNKLLISATPRWYGEVMRLIAELDILPPQVLIQVLIAEVDLNNTQEFGVELGLQSPILFSRSTLAADGTATPGFLFNTTNPLGNNVNAPDADRIGVQGLGNLGVGRASPTANVGGFIFAASSNSFSLLIRALKTQQRIEILSRPQIMTTDGQLAAINIGQQVPFISSTALTATGFLQQNIDREILGVNLQVRPKINPDGTVLMRVTPQISSLGPLIDLGNGSQGQAFNIQQVDTTISAQDGETVVIGGLITKRDEKRENKIPWLGDLPYLGAAFRFRTQTKQKVELLVILTPHIIRSRADRERIMLTEKQRIDWIEGDVKAIHGIPPVPPPGACPPDSWAPGGVPPGLGAEYMLAPGTQLPGLTQPVPAETVPLPPPRPLPPEALPKGRAPTPPPPISTNGGPAVPVPTVPADPYKERRGWNLSQSQP